MSRTKEYYFPDEELERLEIQAFTEEAASIAMRNDEPTSNPPTSEKQIKVHSRDVYGVTKVYPVCKDANHFAAIAGTTTLTPRALTNILRLGYEIIYT